MNRSRYEPVPQIDTETIELSPAHDLPSPYNYNSAIPNSPPPSFHSSLSTPAVSVIDDADDHDRDRAFNNSTPRPTGHAAAATPAYTTSTNADGSFSSAATAAAQIATLHHRVTRLEEALGHLLMEKSASPATTSSSSRGSHSNCCVTYPDPTSLTLAERAELLQSSSNCCVRFDGVKTGGAKGTKAERIRTRLTVLAILGCVLAFMVWIAVLVWLKRGGQRSMGQVEGCEACEGWTGTGTGGKDGATWSGSG